MEGPVGLAAPPAPSAPSPAGPNSSWTLEAAYTYATARAIPPVDPDGDPTYNCPFSPCVKQFSKRFNLKAHLRVHTGDKPFLCSFPGCTRRFMWKSSLTSHQTGHSRKKAEMAKRNAMMAGKAFVSEGANLRLGTGQHYGYAEHMYQQRQQQQLQERQRQLTHQQPPHHPMSQRQSYGYSYSPVGRSTNPYQQTRSTNLMQHPAAMYGNVPRQSMGQPVQPTTSNPAVSNAFQHQTTSNALQSIPYITAGDARSAPQQTHMPISQPHQPQSHVQPGQQPTQTFGVTTQAPHAQPQMPQQQISQQQQGPQRPPDPFTQRNTQQQTPSHAVPSSHPMTPAQGIPPLHGAPLQPQRSSAAQSMQLQSIGQQGQAPHGQHQQQHYGHSQDGHHQQVHSQPVAQQQVQMEHPSGKSQPLPPQPVHSQPIHSQPLPRIDAQMHSVSHSPTSQVPVHSQPQQMPPPPQQLPQQSRSHTVTHPTSQPQSMQHPQQGVAPVSQPNSAPLGPLSTVQHTPSNPQILQELKPPQDQYMRGNQNIKSELNLASKDPQQTLQEKRQRLEKEAAELREQQRLVREKEHHLREQQRRLQEQEQEERKSRELEQRQRHIVQSAQRSQDMEMADSRPSPRPPPEHVQDNQMGYQKLEEHTSRFGGRDGTTLPSPPPIPQQPPAQDIARIRKREREHLSTLPKSSQPALSPAPLGMGPGSMLPSPTPSVGLSCSPGPSNAFSQQFLSPTWATTPTVPTPVQPPLSMTASSPKPPLTPNSQMDVHMTTTVTSEHRVGDISPAPSDVPISPGITSPVPPPMLPQVSANNTRHRRGLSRSKPPLAGPSLSSGPSALLPPLANVAPANPPTHIDLGSLVDDEPSSSLPALGSPHTELSPLPVASPIFGHGQTPTSPMQPFSPFSGVSSIPRGKPAGW